MTAAQQPAKVGIPIFTMKLDAAIVQQLFEQAKKLLVLYAAEFFFTGFESVFFNFF